MAEKERFSRNAYAFRCTVKIIVALLGQGVTLVLLVDFSVLMLPSSAIWQRSHSDLSRGKPALKFKSFDAKKNNSHPYG